MVSKHVFVKIDRYTPKSGLRFEDYLMRECAKKGFRAKEVVSIGLMGFDFVRDMHTVQLIVEPLRYTFPALYDYSLN